MKQNPKILFKFIRNSRNGFIMKILEQEYELYKDDFELSEEDIAMWGRIEKVLNKNAVEVLGDIVMEQIHLPPDAFIS